MKKHIYSTSDVKLTQALRTLWPLSKQPTNLLEPSINEWTVSLKLWIRTDGVCGDASAHPGSERGHVYIVQGEAIITVY